MSGAPYPQGPRPTLLELDGLVRRYRTRGSLLGAGAREVVALNRFSLTIGRGEVFGLVGESGSGKTTAGRLIVRLEDPDAGCIRLAGEDVGHLRGAALKTFRRRVQMIFQDPYQSLNPQLSVFDTVAEPLIIHRIAKGEALVEAVWEALQRAGLTPPEEFAWRYPHRLSGGQRQRVAIARAMVLEPDLLVADEPTSMLDASISAQIFNILHRVRDRFGVTILFITHNLAAARYLCDRIGVIYRGNLMEVGPAHAVIHDPRHPYTKALIDALPKFGQGAAFRRFDTLRSVERDALESVGCPFFARCRVAHPVRCGREAPPLDEVAPGHRAACFYASAPQPETSADATGTPPPE